MTFSQLQAWGIEEESRSALERVSGASLRRASKEAMSIDLDRARWVRGSMSSSESHSRLPAASERAEMQLGRRGGADGECPKILHIREFA